MVLQLSSTPGVHMHLFYFTLSQEENPQAAEVAGGSLPRRPVGLRAPPRAEQLHVRGAPDRGGHRGVRHGPG